MDHKKLKIVNTMKGFARHLKNAMEDNKGIETTVLVYVMAGVILIISIGIAIGALSGAGALVGQGQEMANGSMNKFATDYGVKEIGATCADYCKMAETKDSTSGSPVYFSGGSCKTSCDMNSEEPKFHSECGSNEVCCCA